MVQKIFKSLKLKLVNLNYPIQIICFFSEQNVNVSSWESSVTHENLFLNGLHERIEGSQNKIGWDCHEILMVKISRNDIKRFFDFTSLRSEWHRRNTPIC